MNITIKTRNFVFLFENRIEKLFYVIIVIGRYYSRLKGT